MPRKSFGNRKRKTLKGGGGATDYAISVYGNAVEQKPISDGTNPSSPSNNQIHMNGLHSGGASKKRRMKSKRRKTNKRKSKTMRRR
jgi:hypothetical protein